MLIVTFPVANMEPMNRFVMKTGWQSFSEKRRIRNHESLCKDGLVYTCISTCVTVACRLR